MAPTLDNLFDDDGTCVARLVDGTNVFDATAEGRQIGIAKDGWFFDMDGTRIGRLLNDRRRFPHSELTKCRKKKPPDPSDRSATDRS